MRLWSHLENPNLYYLEQLNQFLFVVDRADFVTQNFVQNDWYGEGKGEGDNHEKLGTPDGVCPYSQGVAGAYGLGYDLAKDDDAQGGANDGNQTRCQGVQQNGQRVVDQHVAQQERT